MLFAYLTKVHGTLHTFDVIRVSEDDASILLRHILMVLYFAMKGRVAVTAEMMVRESELTSSVPLEGIEEEGSGAPSPAASGSQPPTVEAGSIRKGLGTSSKSNEGENKRAPLAFVGNRLLTHRALNLHNSTYE